MSKKEKILLGVSFGLMVFSILLFTATRPKGEGIWTGYHQDLDARVQLAINNHGWDLGDEFGRFLFNAATEAAAAREAAEVAARERAEREAFLAPIRRAAETGRYIYYRGYYIRWDGNTGLLIGENNQQLGRVEMLNRNTMRLTMDDSSTIMLSR